MARNRKVLTVGSYRADYWPTTYNSTTKTYIHTPPKPEGRERLIKRVVTEAPHNDPWYARQGYKQYTFEIVDDIVNLELTSENSTAQVRAEQAAVLEHEGYHGPIGGGEARALKGLFTEMGQPDLVKRGWVYNEIEIWKQPSRWTIRSARWNNTQVPTRVRGTTNRLQNCYVFKSPMPGVSFEQFIKLARMYKDDSGKLKKAVVALLANPDASKELESLNALEILGGLSGMD